MDEQIPNRPDDASVSVVVEPKRRPGLSRDRPKIPRYNVLLWNTDDHTFDYVEKMLRELFGHAHEQCVVIAKTVDEDGRAVVLTTTKEHAEFKRDQILAYGKDDSVKNCAGSMTATIEETS
ncbi:ATP-dependent Clp protease adaptor protein ClpS [Botrimarina colliarenosi]|uniref:ATP-dependent Clp protease adaptor protein ClpS n=1 Tax=Botrimarina colliarenosi TaxID=2528001 RepID=A0A5C6A9Q3_9BACT|nr:ATP-dependent Clp protease adaptor ClpS [Botrimarina colliarenosi]TWT96048.1 ATP-dependent Clp protease adaptor protein ClpS [Botrimarina colliarenosi]